MILIYGLVSYLLSALHVWITHGSKQAADVIYYNTTDLKVIIIDRLYIALFSAHCAYVEYWFWMRDYTSFMARFLISTKGMYWQRCLVVTRLVPCETAAVSAHVLCIPYNHAPVFSVTSFEVTYVVWLCLAVTCHLHFWQNERDILHVIRGRTDTEIRVSTESWPWRRTSSGPSNRNSNPRHFDHESCAPTTELYPAPNNNNNKRLKRTLSLLG